MAYVDQTLGKVARVPCTGPSTIWFVEYQALYRKYRPQRFDEIIGQDHVTHTLAREIEEGRVAHAYLFAGPRGTGKTTTARLLAKSLNCPNRKAGSEPCGGCHSCVEVAASSSMDVLELDAASHNKVEDVRELRNSVSTVASVGGARRVFILDEAHMLTKSAGNALLKTLEEPPDHVHFILATTEPYRLLDTIRSRSQRFDFQLVPADLLAGHLRKVSDAEGYRASAEALGDVARRATGSVRDALSLLEQVAALDGSVTREGVRNALGAAGPEALGLLMESISGEDARAALELIAGLAARGVDLRRFAGDALAFFRGVFLTMYSPNVEQITDEPAEVVAGWQESAGRLTPGTVMKAIDTLGEALVKLREGREERMMLELAVLKLVRPELDDGMGALLRRVEKLERQQSRGTAAVPSSTTVTAGVAGRSSAQVRTGRDAPLLPEAGVELAAARVGGASSSPDPDESGAVLLSPEPTTRAGADSRSPTAADLDRIWPQLMSGVREQLGIRRAALFQDAIPVGVEGFTLVFAVPAAFHLEQLSNDGELKRYLADRGSELLGASVSVTFRAADGSVVSDPEAPRKPEPAPLPDRDSLEEAPASTIDAISLLEETLGARVVEEG